MEVIYKKGIQRLLPVLQAMAEGRTIQTKNGDNWIDIDGDCDGLRLDSIIEFIDCYRIKPEPAYRPFKDAEECWAEMKKHEPFGWVIKHNKDKMLIGEVDSFGGVILYNQRGSKFDFDEANRIFTFADGTPFGVKVAEE